MTKCLIEVFMYYCIDTKVWTSAENVADIRQASINVCKQYWP